MDGGAPLRIGVRVVAAEQDVAATVRALHETIARPFELLILADPAPGEEAGVTARLDALRGVAQWRAPWPGGGAACFNRLAAGPPATIVLIEAGALPGTDWLDRLVATLDGDAANGLAGPATNRCWNAQEVSCQVAGDPIEIERQAEALARAHGDHWQSLAPLHGIGDFCLAVRAEAVAAIGAADTGYARGPCWEMDYAARAARAGFRSVFVPAAFVWRAPAGEQRVTAETAALDRSKQLYQDRFCGRRLVPGGANAPYRAHCMGDACPAFAPPAAIRVALPLATIATPHPRDDRPLISCIMPTRGRARFVARAIAYFRAQDYPARELIVVYDDDADLPPDIAGDDIRLLRADARSIGAKRNQGVAAARGTIIAQWDDDDWYGPGRLSHQAAPILAGIADVTALNGLPFLDLATGAFWGVTRALFRRLFVENVSGGSLVYRRENWRRDGPYPATSLREDCDLLVRLMRGGARLCRLPAAGHSIYIRHAANTWRFGTGSYLDRAGWHQIDEPPGFAADRAFYDLPVRVPAAPASDATAPLVSCIMPTADRRAFVPHAIRQFQAQLYPARELIVIDDGTDPIADLVPDDDDRVRYVRLAQRHSVGAKRNIACELARGGIVAHWDDDDWMAPGWLDSQVVTLIERDAEIVGLDSVLFYAAGTRSAWRYVYDGPRPWVYGGTLCYTLEYWRRTRFPDRDVGEDNAFVWNGRTDRIAVNPARDGYVGMIHDRNTSPKETRQRRWYSYPAPLIERLMGIAAPSDDHMAHIARNASGYGVPSSNTFCAVIQPVC